MHVLKVSEAMQYFILALLKLNFEIICTGGGLKLHALAIREGASRQRTQIADNPGPVKISSPKDNC